MKDLRKREENQERERIAATPLSEQKWWEREPVKAYEWARDQYLEGAPLAAIVEKTGYPEHKIRNWIYSAGWQTNTDAFFAKCWREQKKSLETKLAREMYRIEKERILNTLDKTLTIIDKTIEVFTGKEEGMSVRDVKDLTVVAAELHRIASLEEGKPTEILGRTKLTHKSVLERLKRADPFVSYDPKEEKPTEMPTDDKDPVIN